MKNVCGVDGIDPENADRPFHRLQGRAVDSAGVLHQSRRRRPDDHAGLPRLRHALANIYGGEVHKIPLLEKNISSPTWLRSRRQTQAGQDAGDQLSEQSHRRIGHAGSFSPRWSHFAKKHNLIVIHDAAYAALVFEGKPLSFLATPGAMDVGVELHSMSKGFNMTGWRLGFVVGNPLIVRAYADVKDNTDSGQFLAIQEACAYALDHPEITQQDRRQIFPADGRPGRGPQQARPRAPKSRRGSFFLYVQIPEAPSAKTASASTFEKAEALQPMDDHREADQHGAMGRCRGVRPLQRDILRADGSRRKARAS